MRKIIALVLVVLTLIVVLWLWKSEDSSSGKLSGERSESPKESEIKSVAIVDADVHDKDEDREKPRIPVNRDSKSVNENHGPDHELYKSLDSIPANAENSVVQDALVAIAYKATDLEKALNVFHEYGVIGYTPSSIVISRMADENPERAKAAVNSLLIELQSVVDDDISRSSAICGSIGNINKVDATEDIIAAIKSEPSTRKRHCLFGVFMAYENIPTEKQKQIIDLAMNDKAKEIQQTGLVWKRMGRILNHSEMSKEYEKGLNQK